jgi:5-methyltetrahydropteroyltriglutamate--homocysteine methyltransferase
MITTNLGYPRIGPDRELKRAVEDHWNGKLGGEELLARADEIRREGWRRQAAAGIGLIPSNDFALYDHMLGHAAMFGAVPERYGWQGGDVDLETYFAMARGRQDAAAMEMTKWFNTNYHYIAPELLESYRLTANLPLRAWQAAKDEVGIATKPVIVGPWTFLRLSKNPQGLSLADQLDRLLPLYSEVLAELAAAGVEWVQMDEPILVMDLQEEDLAALEKAYGTLARGNTPKLMLQTYFEDVAHHWERAVNLPTAGIGLDFVRGPENLEALAAKGLPAGKVLGIGLLDGRNVWRTDFDRALATLRRIGDKVDLGAAHLGPSCSLLHLPVTVELEKKLDPAIKSWLAYAEERLAELSVLARAFDQGEASVAAELAENRRAIAARAADPRVKNPEVARRVASLSEADYRRATPPDERLALQKARLGLPDLPTTTIGSFPQTSEVRQARARHKSGAMSDAEYQAFLDEQFRSVIRLQEEIGLDVLVHGEFERSDMVDYFAQQLDGMAFIEGWVQSYGTRCVRPPLIYGDVARPHPMTVEVSRRVREMTDKPLKGMLTGPVTMLFWSFPRNDVPAETIATQLALAIRDEVRDLEAAGIPAIQIDEPALREGLPLQRADRGEYLRWAVRAFQLSSSGVKPETQVHTHMCYSEFNDIMPSIHALGADVISIESSRSADELLEAFRDFDYDRGIGPGVYDVHSKRVPSVEEMAEHLRRSVRVLRADRLWVNPDCGLKTRGYEESVASLKNMVEAARRLRAEVFAGGARVPEGRPTA